MATRTRRTERREEPLSRERIIGAAIELLDRAGESGLTFRALAERLATGPGAIYWHVTGKDELLSAATDAVVADTLAAAGAAASTPADTADATPQEAIRALALGVFDAIDDHPWVGPQLARTSWKSPMLRVMEHLGRQVQALGIPIAAQFASASALMYYILGASNQNAANTAGAPALQPGAANRTEFLATVSAVWAKLDPDEYPFIRTVADQLPGHDDRAEFLTGIDLILAGITTSAATPSSTPH
jgi:AcrR family transcriptional regulator